MASCGSDDGPVDTTAPTTTVTPADGVVRGPVTLTADEAATVYYTVDGTEPTAASPQLATSGSVAVSGDVTLAFFAVDLAGNREATRRATFSGHRFGPLPVERIRAHAVAGDIVVDWLAPPGAARIAIVRSRDALTATPADGATLDVGAAVGGGTVIRVGSDAQLTDAAPGVGGHVYTAFVQHANGVWSEPRAAGAAVHAPEQGTIRFDLGAATATITQPADVTLAVASIAADAQAATLAFDLTITSHLPSLAFAPKVVFPGLTRALTAAVVGSGAVPQVGQLAAFTAYPGAPGVSLDATALDEGASRTVRISLANVSGLATLDLPVAFLAGRGILSTRWCGNDGAFSLSDPTFSVSTSGFAPLPSYRVDRPCGVAQGGGMSADGRFVYTGGRILPRVTKFDGTTGQPVAALDLPIAAAAGAASDVVLDPAGTRLWVVLNDGMHAYSGNAAATDWDGSRRPAAPNSVYLVEVDAQTMVEVGRVLVGAGDVRFRGHRLGLSRDGRRIAVAMGAPYDTAGVPSSGRVAVVDAERRALIDAQPATPALDPIDMPDEIRASQCDFAWHGDRLVCGNSWNNTGPASDTDAIGVVDLTPSAWQMVALNANPAATTGQRAIAFVALPDGAMVLVGDTLGLVKLAPDNTFARLGTTSIQGQSAFFPDESPDRLLVLDYGAITVVDTATGAATQLVGGDGYSHRPLVSPF